MPAMPSQPFTPRAATRSGRAALRAPLLFQSAPLAGRLRSPYPLHPAAALAMARVRHCARGRLLAWPTHNNNTSGDRP